MGVVLVIRHARGVELTPEGQAALDVAHSVEHQVEELRRTLTGRVVDVSGRVRLSCTAPVAMEVLPPILARLRTDHANLGIDVVVDSHASDLDRREADIAIRMFQPRRASLVARRVGESFTALYASRSYVERFGLPRTLDELGEHRVIAPDRDKLFVKLAEDVGVDLDLAAFRTDSFGSTLAWTRAGVAIGALVGTLAERDEDLVQVLEPLQRYPVWLVTHADLLGSAAVRVVWERLAEDLPAVFGAREEP